MSLTIIRLSDDYAMAALRGRSALWDVLPPATDKDLFPLLFMSDWVWEPAEAASRVVGMSAVYNPILGGTVVGADPSFRFWPAIQVRDLAAFKVDEWSAALASVPAQAIRGAGVEISERDAEGVGQLIVEFFVDLGKFIRLANSHNESLAVDID